MFLDTVVRYTVNITIDSTPEREALTEIGNWHWRIFLSFLSLQCQSEIKITELFQIYKTNRFQINQVGKAMAEQIFDVQIFCCCCLFYLAIQGWLKLKYINIFLLFYM